jgi:hypothetical protein
VAEIIFELAIYSRNRTFLLFGDCLMESNRAIWLEYNQLSRFDKTKKIWAPDLRQQDSIYIGSI